MLKDLRTYTFKATSVMAVPASIRDELLACQHPCSSVGDEVHIDGDYMFDASLDESLTPETMGLCKELVQEFPRTEMFLLIP